MSKDKTTPEPTTALAVTAQEQAIAALEEELVEDVSFEDASRPPFLEIIPDKVAKKGCFVLGTKNGDKVNLGDECFVVYLDRPSEVRAVMPEGADKPDCAARDGVPYTDPRMALSCSQCIYNSWPGNKPYRDERGNQCRTKRHIVVDVIYMDPQSGQTVLVPAILVVPPTSLKAERSYRGDLVAMGRLPGAKGGVQGVVTKLKAEYVKGQKGTASAAYEWAVIQFSSEGPVRQALRSDDLYLRLLEDKKSLKNAKVKHEPLDDIASAREFESNLKNQEVDGGGPDDADVPF